MSSQTYFLPFDDKRSHVSITSFALWTALQVLSCSARTQEGVRAVWEKALEFREAMETAGELEVRRKGQRKRLMWSTVKEAFEDRCARFCASLCISWCLLTSQTAFVLPVRSFMPS
jgi:putative protein kinase ArgK-like GTPase of G3E family